MASTATITLRESGIFYLLLLALVYFPEKLVVLLCVINVHRHLRQEENQYLACPPEVARVLSPELQALVGYTMPGTSFGYFAEYQHPSEALQSDALAINWAVGSSCTTDDECAGTSESSNTRVARRLPKL